MPPPFRTVFFDAAGTLFRVKGSVGEVYGRTALEYGFEPAGGEEAWRLLGRSFSQAFRRREPMIFPGAPPEKLPQLEREWWLQVVRDTFQPLGRFPRLEEFFDAVFGLFATSRAWILEPECRQVLCQLRERGMKLGVISNFDSRLEAVLESLDIRGSFDTVVISTVCGSAKPDSAIFQHALAQTSTRPEEALHVGDDAEDDVQGALQAGLQAVLYDPEQRRPECPVRSIGRLGELLEILL